MPPHPSSTPPKTNETRSFQARKNNARLPAKMTLLFFHPSQITAPATQNEHVEIELHSRLTIGEFISVGRMAITEIPFALAMSHDRMVISTV